MTKWQQALTENDLYYIKCIRVTAPLPFMKQLNFEVIDVPGLKSGSFSKIFERMAMEAGRWADRILIFPNSFRSEFPTDYFELMGKIFNDHHIQRNPKTFCYCFGGRTISPENASKEFLDCQSEKTTISITTTFKTYLSDFFDYKFDDIPRGPNERSANTQIQFVESKKKVLVFLNSQFMSFPIPNTNSPNFKQEFEYTRNSFSLMVKKDQLIYMNRLAQQIRELALICIPIMIAKSKYQTAKSRKDETEQLMKQCHKSVKAIVKGLKQTLKKKNPKKAIGELLKEHSLVSCVQLSNNSSHTKLIISHLSVIEEYIKAIAKKHLITESTRDVEEDVKNFSEAVLPFFDLNHENHIVLATEMKGVLNDLFCSFIKTREVEYEGNFNIHFCPLKKDELNSSVLKLLLRTTIQISAKIVANSDSAVKKNMYRRDKTTATIHILNHDDLPVQKSCIMNLSIKKNLQVILSNVQENDFESFKNFVPSSVLLNHHVKTRIAPVFFLASPDVSHLAFQDIWEMYTTESLIIIVTPEENVDMFRDLATDSNKMNHQVRILSVHVENGLYSEGTLMNSVFFFSRFF